MESTHEIESEFAKAASSVQSIRKLWQSRLNHGSEARAWKLVLTPEQPGRLIEPFSILAGAAVTFGETFLAQDIAREGQRAVDDFASENSGDHTSNVAALRMKLSHVIALAHARQGSTAAAIEELDRIERLTSGSMANPELVGLRARIHKDLALAQPAGSELRERWMRRAHELYRDGHQATLAINGGQETAAAAYLGINSAATAVWLGDTATATQMAGTVGQFSASGRADDYWRLATHAEALLIKAGSTKQSAHFSLLASKSSEADVGEISLPRGGRRSCYARP